ncbi:MAG: DNA translocase FtsK [Candidatus Nealsonbacteria bacterium]|nr:DNA translocase FtsK [Candidatus Nealsonbacteria bacterium]
MSRKNKQKKGRKLEKREKGPGLYHLVLPEETKKWIFGILLFLGATIITLSFFEEAGVAGKFFLSAFTLFVGKVIFILPLIFVLGGLVLFYMKEKSKWQVFLAILIVVLGLTGVLGGANFDKKDGGLLGFVIAWPIFRFFGFWAGEIIFFAIIAIGSLILFHSLSLPKLVFDKPQKEKKSIFIKKIFKPKFEVKEVPPSEIIKEKQLFPKEEQKAEIDFGMPGQNLFSKTAFKAPPLDLLEGSKEVPLAGDIKINSTVIKKTLQNFNIPVEMSEVNIGPTVTQYTLKPAEGIKLSKITTLSSDLALALSASSIRIEAPIPGRPLVGIEVPNKTRVPVKLRNLLEHPNFQNSPAPLLFSLGRDVSGNPVFADLSRMPHLLVAGATGTGKTICLNSIVCSFLYRNSPEMLRFILIDPKRVEFSLYQNLPHLLTPVICDAQKTVNAIKWLVSEMERRFDVLSQFKARDIFSYNEKLGKDSNVEGHPMPYIVLIVDELADLMAARGREIEAGIVRLAQMARAVGIHLIVATQRPSVEVITGLIKANITSRIAFQVASQVDSRTILDAAGSEKLLGTGDMLFISAEVSKPKRLQGGYVTEKELRKVVNFINSSYEKAFQEGVTEESATDLLTEKITQDIENGANIDAFQGEEDPLYEEAKKLVIESRKASASLLQRRLRLGYARAARLIDILEERGVVGPGEGAKPREVYIQEEQQQ